MTKNGDNSSTSAPLSLNSNFLKANDTIEEGDTVIIYVNHLVQYAIVVKMGRTFNMKFGALRHEFLIGKKYGTKVTATKGYIYPLRLNPHYWTRTLSRQTQILYTPDIGTILLLLDARPGSIICESGAGSGSLSHAIASAIAPNGLLYSHDINEERVQNVKENLKSNGFDFCSVVCCDVCQHGFSIVDGCDGVFLDLPNPWLAIAHAKRAINQLRGGRLVNFSPCIEQVQKVCVELEACGFIQIEVIELIPRKLKVTSVEKESLQHLADRSAPAPERDVTADANGNGKQPKPQVSRKRPRSPLTNYHDQETLSSINGDASNWMFEMTPFPFNQPTHSGYLVAATLLPTIY